MQENNCAVPQGIYNEQVAKEPGVAGGVAGEGIAIPAKKVAVCGAATLPKAKAVDALNRQTDVDLQMPVPIKAPAVKPGAGRTVEKLVKHKWVPCEFKDLTSGCTFRMFEEDGTPVADKFGRTELIAAVKPSVDKSGTNVIKIY